VGSGDWRLLAGYAAANCIEFETEVLGGFDRPTNSLSDKRWNFDSALLHV
jgi:hypothetical protein